jgi:hypothetical protein
MSTASSAYTPRLRSERFYPTLKCLRTDLPPTHTNSAVLHSPNVKYKDEYSGCLSVPTARETPRANLWYNNSKAPPPVNDGVVH